MPNLSECCKTKMNEYIYNNRGKLGKLEFFDPETMEEFILTPDARLAEEQERQLAESESRPLA